MHMTLYLAFGILIKYFYPKARRNNYVTGHQRKNGNIDMAICHVSKSNGLQLRCIHQDVTDQRRVQKPIDELE